MTTSVTEAKSTDDRVTSTDILVRLNEVRKAIDYIRKDAMVDGKYSVVTHDQVTAMIRALLVEHQVFFVPSLRQESMVDAGTTSRGQQVWRYEAVFHVSVCAAGCSGRVELNIPAHANDFGDKAPGKALSMAVKYAMLKLFALETGEQEEGRVETAAKSSDITAGQVESMLKKLHKLGKDPDSFLENVVRKQPLAGKIEHFSDMKQGLYAWCDQFLDRLIAKAEEETKG